MRRHVLICCLVAVAAWQVASAALALAGRTPAAPRTGAGFEHSARLCHIHAGVAEGDGEYSDGAIEDAFGIGCAAALRLVAPRYRWIHAHWRAASQDGFTLGRFRCRIIPEGPNDRKHCASRGRYFDFL